MATEQPGGRSGDHPTAAGLRHFFGDRTALAETFAEHLGTTAVVRGLIGPREVPRLWTRHILNCAAVAPMLDEGVRLVDVGSGAGLPGVVLAIARPDIQVTLLEPLQRRVGWLTEVTEALELGNVQVLRARAEEAGELAMDVATARALAPLDRLTAWCLPLVRPGGTLLAIKGRSAAGELDAAASALAELGATDWSVREVGGEVLAEPTTVVRIRRGMGRPSSRTAATRQQRAAGRVR